SGGATGGSGGATGGSGGATGGSGGATGGTGGASGGAGGAIVPPSCQGLASNCGASSNESCCTSLPVAGGTFNRSNDSSYPATVSAFRLDKYEVTVGRFRKFVDAVVAGWLPASGSGKHTHLNGGSGLSNSSGTPAQEPGWDKAWDTHLHGSKATWDGSTSLACSSAAFRTWTASPGDSTVERRPITCVNWFQAHAFCIWDGGFLPSEAEWNYAAAGGNEQRTYPWGSTAPGANASLAVYGCYYNGTGTCTGVTNIAPVGSVAAGNGRYGQSDLAGNVWEWNLDWSVSPYVVSCDNCAYLPPSASYRVYRGGSFSFEVQLLLSSFRFSNAPSDRLNFGGARCARTP
ncbi:MAG: formylglycine-generating enzyme family protein, partial [Myxococcales bacterium]|nr:formylglycine-generating enzyme family protein [Myxococcales bacterium]